MVYFRLGDLVYKIKNKDFKEYENLNIFTNKLSENDRYEKIDNWRDRIVEKYKPYLELSGGMRY